MNTNDSIGVDSLLSKQITRRELIKVGLAAGAAAAFSSLPLLGCGQAEPEADHIRFAWYEENLTMDPTMTTMTPTLVLIRPCMFNSLVKQDPEGKIVPDLAESWKSVNPLTWEFKLRKGVKFHNGEPFNAEAVKFTFERLKDPKRASIQAFLWGPVQTVKILDEYTVQIINDKPNGPMIRNLAIGCMLPPKAYDQDKFGTEPIGTGPFVFKEWVRGQKLVMEANKDYWGGPPKAKKITYFPIPEEATRIAALRKGDLDVTFTVPVDQVKLLEGDEKIKMEKILSCDTHVLSIGGKETKLFEDHRLRQAASYAINRQAMIEKILYGFAQMPRSVISPMVFGFNPNLPPGPVTYDVEKAKSLMKAAGKEAGFEAELMYVNGSLPKIADLALAVAADLQKIGITCKVRVFPDFAVGGTFLQPGKFDMFYNSWTTYTLDADMPFWRNWHSSNSREGTGKYDYGKDLDALIEKGRYSLDEKERQEAYYKAQEYMWNFPTRMALYHSMDVWGVRANVKNFKPTASRIVDMFQVYKG